MGATTTECKACRKSLAAGSGHQVAEWTFCEGCFTVLMERPKVQPSTRASSAGPRTDPGRPRCALCKGPVTEDEGIDTGKVRLCALCAGVMQTLVREEQAQPPETPGEPAPPATAQEPVSWKWTACAACGRRIQERAAKLSEGRPYCPDCHQALPPAAAAVTSSTATAAPAPGAACDACERDGSATEVRGGFRLCAACRATDEALALELARARHRKRLEQLKAQLVP